MILPAFLTALLAPAPPAFDGPPLDLAPYCPVFMEDFRKFRVAPHDLVGAEWTAHTPWNGDFGDAAFADPGPGGPFTVGKGGLSITARKGKDGRWRSGLIAAAAPNGHGHGVRYGYFEARMQLPPGPGTWPAFWLHTLDAASESVPGVEIDTMEYYGKFTFKYEASLHIWFKGEPKRNRHLTAPVPVADGLLTRGFHNYGVSVLPDFITWYFDRRPVWRQPTPPELKRPLYPLVNLALGSGWPIDKTPDPSVLLVQYVHVYGYRPADACPAGTRP